MTRIKSLHDPKLQQFIDSMYEFLSEYEDLQDEQRRLSYQITNLKSIRSIKSITLFGINYTKVKYKLDGVKHTIQMIKYLNKNDLGNDIILKSALKKAC